MSEPLIGAPVLALLMFAFVASITPGPNNLMLLASGVNFGFRRTLPHLWGVSIGFGVMLMGVGWGLAALFERLPVAYTVLRVLGTVYLLWLAWGLARAGRPEAVEAERPMGFWAAAAFQWVNPKAWFMGVTAFSAYARARDGAAILAVALLFAAVNLPCIGSWAWLGSRLRHWLARPPRQRVFNLLMAALLVLSLWPMLK
jgi:threonine/homoserine/homoserine lactone efflux protein